MLTVILAGGKGTRLGGGVPKPLVNLDGRPLVEHVLEIYASQGHDHFAVLAGYRRFDLQSWADSERLSLTVWVEDTGEDTQTGGRLRRFRDNNPEALDGPFFLTYADGLADVNLLALLDHHRRMQAVGWSKPLVTLTAVNPANRFGKVNVESGMVTSFSEKMADNCGWVNGGFYVVEPEVIDLIPGDACVFERDILPVLASQMRLAAYQHPGQFLCIDTPRDLAAARDHCKRKDRFWLRWTK